MKLILLHGPPAAGKYTTAKSISEIVPAKILHNHLIVDLSLSIYDDFGQADFFDFNNKLRLLSIQKALDLGTVFLVMTYCYSFPQDNSYLKQIIQFCENNNIDLHPVHICPDEDILFQRVRDENRLCTNKVSDPHLLSELLKTHEYRAIEHKNTISFNNSDISVSKLAAAIVGSFL